MFPTNQPQTGTSENLKVQEKSILKFKIKQKFIEWSQSSTSHGYPNIFRTKNIVVKIMWLIFFLAGIGVGIYMVVRGVNQYFEYEVTTQIRRLRADSLVFPAVSICNINPFVTEAGRLYVLDYFRKKYGSNISNVADARAAAPNYDEEIEELRQTPASPYFDKELRKSFGYEPDIHNCVFNLQPCNYSLIER